MCRGIAAVVHPIRNGKPPQHLFSVSTSGADLGGGTWGELIKTLDQGAFPQEYLIKALKRLDYEGPVGFRCYNVRGDKYANLEKSMLAWRRIPSS